MATRSSVSPLATLPPSPGDFIHERRIELGLTHAVSELSGISQGDISKIENGYFGARWLMIKRLSDALASLTEPIVILSRVGCQRTKPEPSGDCWQPGGRAKHSITRVT